MGAGSRNWEAEIKRREKYGRRRRGVRVGMEGKVRKYLEVGKQREGIKRAEAFRRKGKYGRASTEAFRWKAIEWGGIGTEVPGRGEAFIWATGREVTGRGYLEGRGVQTGGIAGSGSDSSELLGPGISWLRLNSSTRGNFRRVRLGVR